MTQADMFLVCCFQQKAICIWFSAVVNKICNVDQSLIWVILKNLALQIKQSVP